MAAMLVGGLAFPVQGYFQSRLFFSPSAKYLEWFHIPLAYDYRVVRQAQSGLTVPISAAPVGVKYPYPNKKFRMTDNMWRNSSQAVEQGQSDWYDIEIVRQRAEVEEHGPAMDFLAWMYEKGHGLQVDPRKAFMWYERAKLAGEADLRGTPAKIFQRLSPQEKYLARLQLSEDIERQKTKPKGGYQNYDSVKLHVLEQQREYFPDPQNLQESDAAPNPGYR